MVAESLACPSCADSVPPGRLSCPHCGTVLAAVAPESVKDVLALFHAQGYKDACVVGTLNPGEPGISVVP